MNHKIFSALILLILCGFPAKATPTVDIATEKIRFSTMGGKMYVAADIILDSLDLKGNQQIFLTPVLSGEKGDSVILPTLLVTGRNMHYAYERGTMRGLKRYREQYDIISEVRRNNGCRQVVEYLGSTPFRTWMRTENINLQFLYDTCGCGVPSGSATGEGIDTILNPASRMRIAYLTPKVTEIPISMHEGRARVQFEVNRTDLHDSIYLCRNGQRIDNRAQLKVIFDSIAYALNDPNVEIAKIKIIGYASPESQYLHNKELATGRSRALAEYIGKYVGRKYRISPDVTDFDAVAENWTEFREQVIKATDITERQRADLLALIDREAFSPADYDAKEADLKNDPKFRDLYARKILPEWFPHLRATKFQISTRLRPLSDRQLAEVLKSTPEKMSLNQMMRVARLYPEGSEDFDYVIETALLFYPESEEANFNAAATALRKQDFDKAEELLKKAGDSPEKTNAQGVLLAHQGDFDGAKKLFESVNSLPEAQKNLQLLGDE